MIKGKGEKPQRCKGRAYLVFGHFVHGQIFPSQIVPFYSQIFPQFQCKTVCEVPFLASWLKEQGIHVVNALVSACGLKAHENFRLHCGKNCLLQGCR